MVCDLLQREHTHTRTRRHTWTSNKTWWRVLWNIFACSANTLLTLSLVHFFQLFNKLTLKLKNFVYEIFFGKHYDTNSSLQNIIVFRRVSVLGILLTSSMISIIIQTRVNETSDERNPSSATIWKWETETNAWCEMSDTRFRPGDNRNCWQEKG